MERRLKLVNKNDEQLDFMELDNFGHSPEGLGLEMDNVVYQAYSSFTNVQLNIKRNEIKLKITTGAISDKPYEVFHKVLKFLNVGGLKLHYDVPDVGEFIRDVSFQKISKSDAAEFHVLQEELDLACNSPWYTWETISKESDPVFGAGKIYDDEYSIGVGDQLVPNWEYITSDAFATAPLPPGVIVGAGSAFKGYGNTNDLREYDLNIWGRFTVTDATKPAGFRFDTTYYTPGLKVKKGDLFMAEYLIKNDGTVPMTMNNGNVAFRNASGTLTNMTPIDQATYNKGILVPNNNTWQKNTGLIFEAPEDGYAPVAYAYQKTNAGLNSTAMVAGFKLSRVSPIGNDTVGGDYNWNTIPAGNIITSENGGNNSAKSGNWQAWASGSTWQTSISALEDAENVLTLDQASSTSFVRSNIPDILPEMINLRAKFRARVTFNDGLDSTTTLSSIFSLKVYNQIDALLDFTIDNSAIPAYDEIKISNDGTMSGGTKLAAALISDVADPNDGDWHNYEVSFMCPAGSIYAYSIFNKNLPGFTLEVQNYTIYQPAGSVQKEADGPYSVISPRTTIYQIDYTKISPLLDINNESMYFGTQTDSSMRITIRAKEKVIENPKWYLRDLNMTIKQSEGYNLKIEPGNYLVVSSDPFERYTRLYDGDDDTYQDVSTAIDPGTQGWIRIPVGASRLELDNALASATKGFGGPNITVEYKKEWLVV